jgi:hypothetical protein
MTDDRTWWTVTLTDGSETHPHASHIGFNPLGPEGPEVVFYTDRAGSRVDLDPVPFYVERSRCGRLG